MPGVETQTRDAGDCRPQPKKESGKRGLLLPFPKLKRPRGRPRKDLAPAPAPESFDVIATAIKGLGASDHVWARAGEMQRIEMAQLRLRPTTRALVDWTTHRLNRQEGYDWHQAADIAELLGVKLRSVERGYEEAVSTGFFKRRRAGRDWQTTCPRMVGLCIAQQQQLDAAGKGPCPTKKAAKPDRKSAANPTRNSLARPENAGPDQITQTPCGKLRSDPTKKTSLPDQKDVKSPPLSSFPPHPPNNYPPTNPINNPQGALARAMDEIGFQGASEARPEPRFDRSLLLSQRIDVAALCADAFALELARGWDIGVLVDQFCTWMAQLPPPRNAQVAFLGWLHKTAPRRVAPAPAAQEGVLDKATLAAQWAAEDVLDAELRAPLWPRDGRASALPQALGALAAAVVGGVRRGGGAR